MPKFKIYVGLGGGFGGDEYKYTEEFDTEECAQEQAYYDACEEYDSMAGLHGLRSWKECEQEAMEEFDNFSAADQSELEELTDQIYQEERESWLDYHVEEVSDDDV